MLVPPRGHGCVIIFLALHWVILIGAVTRKQGCLDDIFHFNQSSDRWYVKPSVAEPGLHALLERFDHIHPRRAAYDSNGRFP